MSTVIYLYLPFDLIESRWDPGRVPLFARPVLAFVHADKDLATSLTGVAGYVSGFMPGFLAPFLGSVAQHFAGTFAFAFLLYVSLRFSSSLQGRICDRARAAWTVETRVNRLRPTRRRGALFEATLWFTGIAIVTWWKVGGGFKWFATVAAVLLALLWVFRRFFSVPKDVDPLKPPFLLGSARKMRKAGWSVAAYKLATVKIAPAAFLGVSVFVALALGHRAIFDLLSAGGAYCTNTITDQGNEKLDVIATLNTSSRLENDSKRYSICRGTGIRLVEGGKYRIQIEMGDEEDHQWFDKTIRTDVAGFPTDSWRHFFASPLKRWWFENWFQPIARIGKKGNYEHALKPAAPLTPMPRLTEEMKNNCKTPPPSKGDWEKHISSPSSPEYMQWVLACEVKKIEPNKKLISDITADTTGELFLYVNDAVLALPTSMNVFYQNNSGTAQVTVTRILADEIVTPAKENKDQTMV